jgi:glutaredoxin
VPSLELYGTAGCPYTREMREWLEWEGREFIEFDVELDSDARRRMQHLIPAPYNVPFLVEGGKVVQVGWQGRSCFLGT